MKRRPIVIQTLESMIFNGLKRSEQMRSGHSLMALYQLVSMVKEADKNTAEHERRNDFYQGINDLIDSNERYKRLRNTHLNLIKKQRLKIEVLEKEIEFLKEQRNPAPKCYTVDNPNCDLDGWKENDFARDLQTSGFQIPRF
tara:strand:- start:3564 stop:3989 length:426 start_codon:yes stop_codon:yes gene_type:complete